MRIPRRPLLAVSLLVALGCQPPPGSNARLGVRLPSTVQRELASTDQALCGALKVELTFDRTDDLAPPPLDRVVLLPKPNVTCTWVLGEEVQLPSGTYDLIVRFTTTGPVGSCGAPLLIGAYVRRGLSFPFAEGFEGLTDTDFYSLPGEEDELDETGLSFDPDGDERDNLAEVAQGADPCKASSIPMPALSASTRAITETGTVVFDLASVDADDVPHVIALHIAHAQGPNVGTREIVYRHYTDPRGGALVVPPLAGERWSVRAGPDTDDRRGAAALQLRFIADEPFIGPLTAWATVDDGQGSLLAETATVGINVQNVDDPTRLLFGDAGAEATTLTFEEQSLPASRHRFRFDDPDLGTDVGTWTPEIASGPAGLTMARDAGFWSLDWSPSNQDVLDTPPGGYQLDLRFRDGQGQPSGQATLALEITPLFNDAPQLVPPAVGELALPAGAFAEHRIHFAVLDPDQVDAPPRCEATVVPSGGTSCSDPFSTLRCETDGTRAQDRWPFVLILVPSAGYASCGGSPVFSVSLELTDVPPVGSTNGPGVTGTGASPLELRTANVVAAAVVSGGPGAIVGYTDPSPPLIHGASRKAIVQVVDPSDGSRAVTLIDLARPSPSFLHRFPRAELCSLDENRRAKQIAGADEVNARMLIVSRGFDGSSCATNGVNLVQLSPPSTTFRSSTEICGEPFNDRQGNPVVDAAGNFYVACHTTPGRVARIAPNGTLITRTFAGYDTSGSDKNLETAIVTDPNGVGWLVWPDSTGLTLIDLSTFDQATPASEHVALDAGWDTSTIDDSTVDPWRRAYLIAYNRRGQTAQLLRLRFTATGRTLDAPLELGDIGGNTANGYSYMRLVLRDSGAGSTDPGADLVVSPGSSGDPRPHIDLDAWSVTAVRPVVDYYLGGGSAGIFASPDRRFYVAPTTMNYEDGARGLYLYRFDPSAAREFIALPVPNGGADWAGRTEVSESGHLMVISEADGNGGISVLYFVEAEAGRD